MLIHRTYYDTVDEKCAYTYNHKYCYTSYGFDFNVIIVVFLSITHATFKDTATYCLFWRARNTCPLLGLLGTYYIITDKFIINRGLKNTFRLTTNRKEVTFTLQKPRALS